MVAANGGSCRLNWTTNKDHWLILRLSCIRRLLLKKFDSLRSQMRYCGKEKVPQMPYLTTDICPFYLTLKQQTGRYLHVTKKCPAVLWFSSLSRLIRSHVDHDILLSLAFPLPTTWKPGQPLFILQEFLSSLPQMPPLISVVDCRDLSFRLCHSTSHHIT